MEYIMNFIDQTGFVRFFADGNWKCLIMIAISLVLMYLAIVKKFEPLLLLPIAFGMLLTNLPGAEMFHEQLFAGGHVHWDLFGGGGDITAGLIDYLYLGVKLGIYPCLIFIGVGAMTDFGPLIANPISFLLGAAAQFGIFGAYFLAILLGFNDKAAAVERGRISCDGTNGKLCQGSSGQTAGHCSGKRVWQGRQPLWIWKGLL